LFESLLGQELRPIRRVNAECSYFKDKVHLARLYSVHFSLFQCLVHGGIVSLTNVDDLPCEC
jgi:hypothetical protein